MGNREKTKPLAEQIEISRQEGVQDRVDPEVLDYLNEFLKDFHAMPPLEEIDLLSPESAQRAVAMLTERQAELQAKLKTAQALSKLVKEK